MHPSEDSFLRRYDMPAMDLSSTERLRQLMATRNEWKLYHRTCDKTGKPMLSAYPPDCPYTVYKNNIWWGDTWDALDFGREIDFSRPFFEQFHELELVVPREGTSVFESENCDYNSHLRQSKNCYLNSLVVRAEDMYYSYWMVDVEDVLDSCYHIQGKSSLCYECVDFGTCFSCTSSQEIYNCNDCHFSFQLRGCDHCLFCSNLSQQSYHIHNKPCTKEEFEAMKAKLLNGSYPDWIHARETYEGVRKSAIHRESMNINCENTTGDHMFDSKNCTNCFDGDHSEDCSNSISLNDSKDIHSCYSAGWTRSEQLYNCAVSRGCIDMAFCRYVWFSNDMLYCDSCQTCKHCFGCIGLRHKEYCIFNKQYSEEQYKTLKQQLIEHMKNTGEWGAFWPLQMLPFAYNQTAAQDYFPLTKDEALAKGFQWRDEPDALPNAERIIEASQLPDAIDQTPDDVLNWAIRCPVTGKAFKIIKGELSFYRKMKLPLPRLHPDERHRLRMQMRNPQQLWNRTCAKCNTELQTSYAPERPEKVYCEECYLSEVY